MDDFVNKLDIKYKYIDKIQIQPLVEKLNKISKNKVRIQKINRKYCVIVKSFEPPTEGFLFRGNLKETAKFLETLFYWEDIYDRCI